MFFGHLLHCKGQLAAILAAAELLNELCETFVRFFTKRKSLLTPTTLCTMLVLILVHCIKININSCFVFVCVCWVSTDQQHRKTKEKNREIKGGRKNLSCKHYFLHVMISVIITIKSNSSTKSDKIFNQIFKWVKVT